MFQSFVISQYTAMLNEWKRGIASFFYFILTVRFEIFLVQRLQTITCLCASMPVFDINSYVYMHCWGVMIRCHLGLKFVHLQAKEYTSPVCVQFILAKYIFSPSYLIKGNFGYWLIEIAFLILNMINLGAHNFLNFIYIQYSL